MPPLAEETLRPARRAPPPPSHPVRRPGPARRRAGPRRGWRRLLPATPGHHDGSVDRLEHREVVGGVPQPHRLTERVQGQEAEERSDRLALVGRPGEVMEPSAPGDPQCHGAGRRHRGARRCRGPLRSRSRTARPTRAAGACAAASGDNPVSVVDLLGAHGREGSHRRPPPSPPRRATRPGGRAGDNPVGRPRGRRRAGPPEEGSGGHQRRMTRAPPFSTMRGVSRPRSPARGSISARVLLLHSTRAMPVHPRARRGRDAPGRRRRCPRRAAFRPDR